MPITQTTHIPIARRLMRPLGPGVFLISILLVLPAKSSGATQWWISSRDMSESLTPGHTLSFDSTGLPRKATIRINEIKTCQTIIDHKAKPNPGPHDCSPTCIVLDSETLRLDYRFDYYMYGHFTKFIRPGAIRIDSNPSTASLPNVAFRNPDGSIVLVVINPKRRKEKINIEWNHRDLTVELDAESIAIFRLS